MTLALPKVGLLEESARGYVGRLFLADIGVPPELYRMLELQVGSIFADEPIVEI
jgi:NAD(P)H-hydrate epimerase